MAATNSVGLGSLELSCHGLTFTLYYNKFFRQEIQWTNSNRRYKYFFSTSQYLNACYIRIIMWLIQIIIRMDFGNRHSMKTYLISSRLTSSLMRNINNGDNKPRVNTCHGMCSKPGDAVQVSLLKAIPLYVNCRLSLHNKSFNSEYFLR